MAKCCKCDRCGEVFMGSGTELTQSPVADKFHIDLCSKCTKDFNAFMREAKRG